MSRADKPKPIHKRWPGQHAFRVVHYMPSGARLEFETTLPDDDAKALSKRLVASLSGDNTVALRLEPVAKEGG
jgi:hypothetical protein